MPPRPNVKIEGVDPYTDHHDLLDLGLLRQHINIVSPQAAQDFSIQFNAPGPQGWNKTLVAYMEPPLSGGYVAPHERAQEFHTVYTFRPSRPNQFPITEDPIVFPHPPNTSWDRRREEREKKPQERLFYYAGARAEEFWSEPDRLYRRNFYELRTRIVEGLVARGMPCAVYGRDWGTINTRTTGDFQANKAVEIEAADADFVLCLDNSQLDNYISEKIQNGFQSDRVVCYLGEANIEKWVPREAFINLNHLANPVTKEFDHDTLFLTLHHMEQDEYDGYIEVARAWRASDLEERWKAQSERLTKHMLFRMIGRPKP